MTDPVMPDTPTLAANDASVAPPAPVDPPVTPEAEAPPTEPEAPPVEPEADTVAESEAPEPEPEEPDAHPASAAAEVAEESAAPVVENKKHWYVVKVQSGREDTIKEAIERKVRIEGLEEFYGQIVIPTEQVIEMRKGKRVKKERKLFPGYLMAEVEYNDRILYLFRETSGVGDFVGGTIHRPPPPMSPREIERMMGGPKKKEGEDKVISKPEFSPGDRVKVKEGAFSGMEGEVKEILEAKGQVRVEVMIFGRPVSLEMEYWQVESV